MCLAVDAQWLREVSQGGRLPQRTVRAVLLGAGIGFVMCLCVAVTAGLLAHSPHGVPRRPSSKPTLSQGRDPASPSNTWPEKQAGTVTRETSVGRAHALRATPGVDGAGDMRRFPA